MEQRRPNFQSHPCLLWRKLGIKDMSVPNLLALTLKYNKLEIRSDIIAQLVLKYVLPPDSLTGVRIWKCVA
jgi:hypothetical protein